MHILVMVGVLGTDEFTEWFRALDEAEQDAVAFVIASVLCVRPGPEAVLLIGGDKSGDKKFYERMIVLAERIWAEYLKETGL